METASTSTRAHQAGKPDRIRSATAAGRPVLLVCGIGAMALALGTALALAGSSLWLLALSTAFALTLLLGQVMSWASALVSTLAIQLIGLIATLRTTALIDSDIATSLVLALALTGFTSLVLVARRPHARVPSVHAVAAAAHALAVPALFAVVASASSLISGGTHLAWGMNNDAATNTMFARTMWADGGIDTAATSNPAPLTQATLIAVWAPGRSQLMPHDLLSHDLQRNAELWIASIALSSLLAALLVIVAAKRLSPRARLLLSCLAALVPLSWYALGTTLQFGFMNAPLVIALLCGMWLVWSENRATPALGLAGLSLLTTALLASWAPLALLPLALYGALLLWSGSSLWRNAPKRDMVIAAAATVQLLLYLGIVTLPDFLRTSGALSVNGAMAPMTPQIIVVTGAVLLVAAVLGWSLNGDAHTLLGTVMLLLAGSLAVGFLVFQRRSAESLWGYYPAKFSWFLSILLIVMIVAVTANLAVAVSGNRRRIAIHAASAAMTLALLIQIQPTRTTLELTSTFLDLNPATAARPIEAAVVDLVAISNPETRDLAVGLSEYDQFVNLWLIHMTVPDERDPIRVFGYVGDPSDLQQVCQAVETWGGDVTIHTRDETLEESLSSACSEGYVVVVQK